MAGTIQRQMYRQAAEAAPHQDTALVHWGPVPDPLKLLNARLGRWGEPSATDLRKNEFMF